MPLYTVDFTSLRTYGTPWVTKIQDSKRHVQNTNVTFKTLNVTFKTLNVTFKTLNVTSRDFSTSRPEISRRHVQRFINVTSRDLSMSRTSRTKYKMRMRVHLVAWTENGGAWSHRSPNWATGLSQAGLPQKRVTWTTTSWISSFWFIHWAHALFWSWFSWTQVPFAALVWIMEVFCGWLWNNRAKRWWPT